MVGKGEKSFRSWNRYWNYSDITVKQKQKDRTLKLLEIQPESAEMARKKRYA
ncbi:MAG: hypothetical protein ACLRR3_00520 [Eubacterium sp.]